MSTKITQAYAKNYIDLYHDACQQKGENKSEVIKYLEITKAHLEEIFSKATTNNTPCEKIRIYFGKLTPYDTASKYPKFCSKDDYNLVIVGVDSKGANIVSTSEIYDHMLSVAGEPNTNDF